MRSRIFVFLSVLTLLIGVAVFALGKGEAVMAHLQHRGDGPRGMGPEMIDHIARELNLTDTQKTQVKSLFEAGHATLVPLQQKIGEVRKQLEAATANGQFDETQVRALATQQAQLQAETIVEHERMKSKIFALLTAEQRVKAEEMHKRYRRHMHGDMH
jgi:Spy/CpxP family protein refolding chaperone